MHPVMARKQRSIRSSEQRKKTPCVLLNYTQEILHGDVGTTIRQSTALAAAQQRNRAIRTSPLANPRSLHATVRVQTLVTLASILKTFLVYKI